MLNHEKLVSLLNSVEDEKVKEAIEELIMLRSNFNSVKDYIENKPKPFSLITLELMLGISLYKVYGNEKYCRWCGHPQPDGVEGYHITQCPTKDVSLF